MELVHRPRRLRRNESIRTLVRESAVAPGDLIAPLFIKDGKGVREPIDTMPCFSGMGMVTIQVINEMGIRFPEVHTSAENLARSGGVFGWLIEAQGTVRVLTHQLQ